MAKKYIGWGIAYEKDGQKAVTIVPAKSKKEAIEKLEGLDLKVIEEKQIRHVCIVKYPGPLSVKAMESQDWNDAVQYLPEEATNG